jgi:hypothetical protein
MRLPVLLLGALLSLTSLAPACSSKATSSTETIKDPAVTVNGRRISEAEVQLRRRDRSMGEPVPTRDAALEQVVTLELQAQRAEQLGLDQDPDFLAKMEQVAVQVRDARRSELAKLYRLKEVLEKAKPTEAEVQAYYAGNAKRLRTEYLIEQLFTNSRAAAEADAAVIAKGASFEEVALARAKAMLKTVPVPDGFKPYELPPMTFDAVPPEWWPALDALAPGGVSGVIAMPKERFAIIRLLSTKELPEVTLETVRPRLEAVLKAKALEERRLTLDADLRRNATIERRGAPKVPEAKVP